MPRNGSGVYSLPPGSTFAPNILIQSSVVNGINNDLATDLNTPRPIVAGGTGASTPATALAALGGFPASSASWVTIIDTTFAGVASVSFTNLGTYRRLRMIGAMISTVSSGFAYRTSTNNGSSYDSGATDYAYQNATFASGTVAASSTAAGQGSLSGGVSNDLAVNFMFEAEFESFNTNGNQMVSMSRARLVNGGALTGANNYGFRQSTVARNAFIIFPTSGGTIAGRILLEGCV